MKKKNTWNIRLECATWLPETWEPEKKTCESRHRTGQVWDFQTSGFPNSTRRGLEATWFILWIFYCTWRPENTTLASKMIPFCIPFCIAFCIPFCIPFIRHLVDESYVPSKPLIWVCKFYRKFGPYFLLICPVHLHRSFSCIHLPGPSKSCMEIEALLHG